MQQISNCKIDEQTEWNVHELNISSYISATQAHQNI